MRMIVNAQTMCVHIKAKQLRMPIGIDFMHSSSRAHDFIIRLNEIECLIGWLRWRAIALWTALSKAINTHALIDQLNGLETSLKLLVRAPFLFGDCVAIFIAKPYRGALSRSQHNFAGSAQYSWYKVNYGIMVFVAIDEWAKVLEFG